MTRNVSSVFLSTLLSFTKEINTKMRQGRIELHTNCGKRVLYFTRHRNAAFRAHPNNFMSRSPSRPRWHQNVREQSLLSIFPATHTRISATCSHDLAVWQVNGSALRNSMSLFNFLQLARRPQRNFTLPTECRWLQWTNGTKSRSSK